jgi:hypothetical protein
VLEGTPGQRHRSVGVLQHGPGGAVSIAKSRAFHFGFRRKVWQEQVMLDIEKAIEEADEQCSTCGTGFRVRICSECATGHAAWMVWSNFVLSQLRATGIDPSEVLDHTGRISVENKRSIDRILNTEFDGQVTVRNVAAAAAAHVQRQRLAKEAAQAAQEAAIAARQLAVDRYLAARLQKHADVAASRTIVARIKRLGKTLRSLL